MSRNTVAWAAKQRYPYVMLATELEPTRQSFDYYGEVAAREGYQAGTHHRGYLFKVHVDESEALADEVGRKYIQGPSNPFLEGNQGNVRPFLQNLPGLTSRTNLLPTITSFAAAASRGRQAQHEAATGRKVEPEAKPAPREARDFFGTYSEQTAKYSIISGTPKTVLPRIRHVLEYLRPGTIFFWDGDGAMSHEDSMRSLRLMGEEVLPAVREMGRELGLSSPFEIDPRSNQPFQERANEPAQPPSESKG
jgi:alkanesulfonate monooxygenase SsuD/methylene tetrahydromethanopterin reductase-like flavin-dependent oxidoreductase (luciferase family)